MGRDGNRTEPEPNTPNSNPIQRPFWTEPNEPKEFDNRIQTELSQWPNRTEPELSLLGSIPISTHAAAVPVVMRRHTDGRLVKSCAT